MDGTAMRIAVLAAWVGGLVLLAGWSETTPALVCAGAATIAAGPLVGAARPDHRRSQAGRTGAAGARHDGPVMQRAASPA
jgi:hypothetical protein